MQPPLWQTRQTLLYRCLALMGVLLIAACEIPSETNGDSDNDSKSSPPASKTYATLDIPRGAHLSAGALSSIAAANLMALPSQYRQPAYSLLERTLGPWRLDMSAAGGVPPNPADVYRLNCQSDFQVSAAVVWSWGAEAYARANDSPNMINAVNQTKAALHIAYTYCDPRTNSRADCSTVAIIDCPELSQYR